MHATFRTQMIPSAHSAVPTVPGGNEHDTLSNSAVVGKPERINCCCGSIYFCRKSKISSIDVFTRKHKMFSITHCPVRSHRIHCHSPSLTITYTTNILFQSYLRMPSIQYKPKKHISLSSISVAFRSNGRAGYRMSGSTWHTLTEANSSIEYILSLFMW